MKLTAETMIISRVCVHPFERFERALKNVSDEIRLNSIADSGSSPTANQDLSAMVRLTVNLKNTKKYM